MTEQSRHWDGVALGDATLAPYSASEWADQEKLEHGLGVLYPNYGVIQGTSDGTYYPLAVLAKSPASSNIELEIGAALVRGYLYENTAALTLAVGANASGNARIDTLILRADLIAQTVRAVVKQGTPAASPARVAMQQDTAIWEIPLADIAVANGFSTLAQSAISPRQRFIIDQSRGWQPVALPLGYAAGSTIGSSTVLAANGGTVLICIPVHANMAVGRIRFVTVSNTGQAYQIGWDLYREEINDAVPADAILRRVSKSVADLTGTFSVGTDSLNILAEGPPVPITPGVYWLAFQNRHATNTFQLGVVAPNQLDNALVIHRSGTKVVPLTATLDGSLFVAAISGAPTVALLGRIFGETTP